MPWGIAALMAVVSVTAIWKLTSQPAQTPQSVKRFITILPRDEFLGSSPYGNDLAFSPDGKHLVYAAGSGTDTKLYLHALDEFEATVFSGTGGASYPFFSPDGRWVGFFADNKLKKVLLAGGRPLTLTEFGAFASGAAPRGAAWGPDETIIFVSSGSSGLMEISTSGGEPHALTSPDSVAGETVHLWPQMLPGGKAMLFTIAERTNATIDGGRIAVLSLETGTWRVLLDEEGYNARYASTDHIVYMPVGNADGGTV